MKAKVDKAKAEKAGSGEDGSGKAVKAGVAKDGNDGKSKTTVLLAPSWGGSSIFNRLGSAVLEELVKTDYDIIVRPHPQSFIAEKALMDELMSKFPDSDRLKWDRSPDNFETLNKADIHISDFSGVFFDFALVFDKPIMYMDTDYDNGWYDYYCLDDQTSWIMHTLPKLGKEITKENLPNIGSLIKECLNSSEFSSGRDIARQETWAHMGEGAARTVDYLTAKYEEIKGRK